MSSLSTLFPSHDGIAFFYIFDTDKFTPLKEKLFQTHCAIL